MSLWIEDYVQKNQYSRPAIKLIGVKGIVMHWTATNGASDENEQNFFDGTDGGGGRYASAHIFVDRDSARLIIPLDEVAYHANEHPCKVDSLNASVSYYKGGGANLTSIGIEMCVEKDGTIHKDTVAKAVDIVVELCKRYKLNPLTDIYRHFDITGKNCPAPWVDDKSKFDAFKKNVNTELHPIKPVSKPVVKPVSKPSANKKYLVLPKSSDSWNVYPLDKAPVKANACGSLNPNKFGGLTYEILGNPQADVYIIKTDAFGKVQIYASKATGAKVVEK